MFTKGDKVVVTSDTYYSGSRLGETGVVIGFYGAKGPCATYDPFSGEEHTIGVDFGKPITGGHSLDGRCDHPNGWYFREEDLSTVTPAAVGSETTNPIFHYQASESLGEDAWKVLVKGITFHDGSWETASEKFKEWEAEAPKPYPGAYRSAKSVIKGAINNSIPLLVGGEPRGKTAVQKDIKAAKDRDKEVKDPDSKFGWMLGKTIKYANEHGIDWRTTFSTAIDSNL